MIPVTLTRISQNPDAKISDKPLRTDTVVGFTHRLPPVPGDSVRIFNDIPLDSRLGATHRMVETSTVQSVQEIPGGYRFETMNSVYTLLIHAEVTKF